MRNIFLVLLLANLLFAAWRSWIAPPELAPRELPGAAAEQVLQLKALPSSAASSGASAVVAGQRARPPVASSSLVGQADGACLRLGPFPEAEAAGRLRAWLAGRGVSAGLQVEEGRIRAGHGLQFEAATAEELRRMTSALAALGELRVSGEAPPYKVQIDGFSQGAGAERAATEARALGFRPQLVDLYHPASRYWLVVDGHSELAGLDEEAGRALQVETVPCRPAVGAATAIQ